MPEIGYPCVASIKKFDGFEMVRGNANAAGQGEFGEIFMTGRPMYIAEGNSSDKKITIEYFLRILPFNAAENFFVEKINELSAKLAQLKIE